MIQLPDVGRDHEYPEGLVFHEGCGRDEAVHRHRPPADAGECVVDLLHRGDAFDRQSCVLQSRYVGIVGGIFQVAVVLPHDVPPHCVVYRCVPIIGLGYDVPAQAIREGGYLRVSVGFDG